MTLLKEPPEMEARSMWDTPGWMEWADRMRKQHVDLSRHNLTGAHCDTKDGGCGHTYHSKINSKFCPACKRCRFCCASAGRARLPECIYG